MAIQVTAGKLPGAVTKLQLNGGGPYTVLDVLIMAGEQIGTQKSLGRSAFSISTEVDDVAEGASIDLPQLNGRILASKVGERWTDVQWNTPVNDNDIVLVVAKIQGNSILVEVGRDKNGPFQQVAIYSADETDEGGEDAGSVKQALEAASITLSDDEKTLIIDADGDETDNSRDLDTELDQGDKVVIVKLSESEINNETATIEFAGEPAQRVYVGGGRELLSLLTQAGLLERFNSGEYVIVGIDSTDDTGIGQLDTEVYGGDRVVILSRKPNLAPAVAASEPAKDGEVPADVLAEANQMPITSSDPNDLRRIAGGLRLDGEGLDQAAATIDREIKKLERQAADRRRSAQVLYAQANRLNKRALDIENALKSRDTARTQLIEFGVIKVRTQDELDELDKNELRNILTGEFRAEVSPLAQRKNLIKQILQLQVAA